jgi:hypothetical protein
MRHDPGNPGDAYQVDDDPPTLTYCAPDMTLALPYHLVRSMQLGKDADRVVVEYDDYTATISGGNLGRLWRELRAYRLKEVSINGGAAARAIRQKTERCLVETITIARTDGDVPEESELTF